MRKYYKIAFCGLGSIGKRHLRNTVKYLKENGYHYQIDAIRSDLGHALESDVEMHISKQYDYNDCIPEDYDIIFVTNPTSMHRDTINKYKKCTRSMFIEKPIVDTDLSAFEDMPNELICYVACPLRYTKVLQYIKKNIDCEKAYSVRAICSTYLPNWHPNDDYRKLYSAHRSMGGGVSIDLIHEWDYLVWLFGKPNKITSICEKVSELEIDSDDIAVYIGQSDSRIYELHLDYFGKVETRELEIHFPKQRIQVDIRNGIIRFSDEQKELSLQEERDGYQLREIAHFFEIIEGRCENDNTIENAMEMLKIAMMK